MDMAQEERWEYVLDTYGVRSDYAVSTLGRVKSLKKGREGRIMRGGGGPSDRTPHRRSVWLMNSFDSNSRKKWVDELVAVAFLGAQPMGTQLVHLNGCAWDDRAENLKWATEEDLPSSVHVPLHTPEDAEEADLKLAKDAAWAAVKMAHAELGRLTEKAMRATEAWSRAWALGEAQTGTQGREADGTGEEG